MKFIVEPNPKCTCEEVSWVWGIVGDRGGYGVGGLRSGNLVCEVGQDCKHGEEAPWLQEDAISNIVAIRLLTN